MQSRRFLAAVAAICLLLMAIPARPASAASKYYITVDLTNQIVTVYDSNNVSNSGIVRMMICSSGKAGTRTPTGTFYLPSKSRSSERTEWYYFSEFKCYAKWATRIRGGILFHSVLYSAAKRGPTSASVNALGSPASHGCIRLRVDDARWIAQNCPAGTKCKIYYSGTTNAALRRQLKNATYVRSGSSTPATTPATVSLAYGSRGTQVSQLQTRLTQLGFLNDKIDGIFGAKTQAAVMAFQAAAGVQKTGKVDQALWNKLFNTSAPVGLSTTLSEGSTGESVSTLQQALITLKMMEGAADGTYGAATAEAVSRYQQTFGLPVTGTASADLQKAIVSKATAVKQQFGDSTAYELTAVTTQTAMARVKVNTSLNLRQYPSTSAKVLTRMANNTVIQVHEVGNPWIKVTCGKFTGYVDHRYVTLFTSTATELEYVPVEVTPTPEPEETPAPEETPEPGESAEPTESVETTAAPTPTPIPAGAQVTLSSGDQGEPVKALQEALRTLKLYDGPANGQYDAATAEAVKRYENTFSLTETEDASVELQKAVADRAAAVRQEFGDSTNYALTAVTTETPMARVKVNTWLNLRQYASTSARVLAKLWNNMPIVVLEQGTRWIKIAFGNTVGYVDKTYVVFYTDTSTTMEYVWTAGTDDASDDAALPLLTLDGSAPTDGRVPTEDAALTDGSVPTDGSMPTDGDKQTAGAANGDDAQLPDPAQLNTAAAASVPATASDALPAQDDPAPQEGHVPQEDPAPQENSDADAANDAANVDNSATDAPVNADAANDNTTDNAPDVTPEAEATSAATDAPSATEATPAANSETPATPKPTQAPRYAVVRKNATKVYAKPEAKAENVIETVDAGAVYDIVEIGDEWIAVKADKKTVYFRAADVELALVKPAATATPAPKATAKPTEKPTEAPTAAPTQAPTAVPTAAPTEVPTQKPTEVPTQKPTEAPAPAQPDPESAAEEGQE